MSDKIISPNFGGGPPGGGEPPKPPTYEELLFDLEKQKELTQHFRNLLAAKEEEHNRLSRSLELALKQIEELEKLTKVNAQVFEQASKNLNALSQIIKR